MRLQQHVGDDGRVLQLGMLAPVARILVAADVVPGPAVEAALLDVRDVVGDQVVAQLVALVDRRPQLARTRMHGDPDGVADPGRVDAATAAVGRELEHVGALLLGGRRVRIVVVRPRADRHEHARAVARERDVARPVTAAAQQPAARQLGDHRLRRPASHRVPAPVRQPHDRVGVGDVEPARIGTRRIERDAERLVEALREHTRPGRLAAREQAAEHAHHAVVALDDERVTVRRRPDQPRLRQAVGVQLHRESSRRLRPGVLRPLDHAGPVVDGPGRARRRQVGGHDLDALARAFGRVVGERARTRGAFVAGAAGATGTDAGTTGTGIGPAPWAEPAAPTAANPTARAATVIAASPRERCMAMPVFKVARRGIQRIFSTGFSTGAGTRWS